MKGLILRSTGLWYDVLADDNHRYKGRLRGRLRLNNDRVTNPIAVGDKVEIVLEDKDENTVLIEKIDKRTNYINRQSPKKDGFAHTIAANIDQAIVVVTLAMPRTSAGFIDRFLVAAEAFRIPGVLIFNKIDLLSEQELFVQSKMMERYEQIGYKCMAISATEDEDIMKVENILRDKVSLVSGHSGVGKSTLLNRLSPEITQSVQEVSDYTEKGLHTTTFAEMFEIFENTFVIDTPGIKELGLMNMEKAEISHYFPEMRELLNQCKYDNCLHLREPQCAVIAAVESGEIAKSRYNSYLSMMDNDDNRR
ncbi:ribosome small subunit-dependent GTPase A [Bernardetia litoralis DSM 6794]|uniref:Small ribosomal subunit biogenesis GTPase RsgA n=1 Tax=Bernardetia litoralis (strain ATCC 23117 / DSM 6794 / NBRC 15988 / NCIMB 1366 / Fx l1 / Sio-4) TaxID=880071 RepID=I4AFK2_BERLS|nr:ribosome small subunit-dependent GTPase A [Bernardetia litoralis]AFM02737.1 ribosome small subunit-dependent GTPase A [Bernardetia litoralis DSM 6794]